MANNRQMRRDKTEIASITHTHVFLFVLLRIKIFFFFLICFESVLQSSTANFVFNFVRHLSRCRCRSNHCPCSEMHWPVKPCQGSDRVAFGMLYRWLLNRHRPSYSQLPIQLTICHCKIKKNNTVGYFYCIDTEMWWLERDSTYTGISEYAAGSIGSMPSLPAKRCLRSDFAFSVFSKSRAFGFRCCFGGATGGIMLSRSRSHSRSRSCSSGWFCYKITRKNEVKFKTSARIDLQLTSAVASSCTPSFSSTSVCRASNSLRKTAALFAIFASGWSGGNQLTVSSTVFQ